MKSLKLWGCLCLLPFLAGCTAVGSAHPLFTGKETAENPPIAGVWEPDDHDITPGTFTVKSSGNGVYEVSWVSEAANDPKKNQTVYIDATIRSVGKQLLFDASFDKLVVGNSEFSADDVPGFPMHFIGVIRVESDKAILQLPDGDWLEAAKKNGEPPVAFVKEADIILLLPEDAELQSFILKYSGDEKAFPPIKFHRKK